MPSGCSVLARFVSLIRNCSEFHVEWRSAALQMTGRQRTGVDLAVRQIYGRQRYVRASKVLYHGRIWYAQSFSLECAPPWLINPRVTSPRSSSRFRTFAAEHVIFTTEVAKAGTEEPDATLEVQDGWWGGMGCAGTRWAPWSYLPPSISPGRWTIAAFAMGLPPRGGTSL